MRSTFPIQPEAHAMKLTFHGGAGTVTGSRTLVEGGGARLLVDCGMFQGWKALRQRNREPYPFDPASLNAVVLTHAHLDHSGMLPVLVREGFSGPVHCTRATAELLKIMLRDSARIHEEDASYARRRGYSRHKNPTPLYTLADANLALERLAPVDWLEEVHVGTGMVIQLRPGGHILGASTALVCADAQRVLFSGDLGRPDDLLMEPPSPPPEADLVVLESTYGDRLHGPDNNGVDDPVGDLGRVLKRTLRRRGVALIPTFAVGRAQNVLRAISLLKERGTIPKHVPVILDSPMAVDTTQLYLRHARQHRLDAKEQAALREGVELIRATRDSKRLARLKEPHILVSSAGMLTGGRVLHHLARLAPKGVNTLIFVGYQAGGTRGAHIMEGATSVKVHGSYVPIACEVASIQGFSAHADQRELVDWLSLLPTPPRAVVLNHGEPHASDTLRKRVEQVLDWPCEVARDGGSVDIGALPEAPVDTRGARAEDEPSLHGLDIDTARRLDRVVAHPHFRRADEDPALLQSTELRGIRLMLEYSKVEQALQAEGITDTVVVFGGTEVISPEKAEAALTVAKAALEADNQDADVIEEYAIAERRLARSRDYTEAQTFGALAATCPLPDDRELTVVTGGGPGIMEAANRGAAEEGERTVGLCVTLPNEQAPNPWITPGLGFQFRYFALRKLHFLARARAMVAFPGGYGTLDEVFEVLCLVETGKMPRIPVVLVDRGFWTKAINLRHLADEGLIDNGDLELVTLVDTAEEAWEVIEGFYDPASQAR